MNPQIYAAIDVGSNSVRLLIAREEDGFLRHIYSTRSTTRLMNGVKDSLLIGEPVENTAQAVSNFVKTARRIGAAHIDAFGTSALRDAKNSDSFSDRTEELCGVRVKVISGVDEAQLAFAGAAPFGKCGVIDIGGGSTELIIGENGQMLRAHSAQVGAVRLMNLLQARLNPQEMYAAACDLLKDTVSSVCTDAPEKWIGVGGTITTLAAMSKQVSKYSPNAIADYPLTEEKIHDWLHRLCVMTVEERCGLIGLQSARADVIPYGTAILLAVIRMAHAEPVHACDHDNLEGYIRRCMMPRFSE